MGQGHSAAAFEHGWALGLLRVALKMEEEQVAEAHVITAESFAGRM